MEKILNKEIAADPEDMSWSYRNMYTGEKIRGEGKFAEEDKERVRDILNHADLPAIMESDNGSEIRRIYRSEIDAFFQGDKTAEDTAHIIQNRISPYLKE